MDHHPQIIEQASEVAAVTVQCVVTQYVRHNPRDSVGDCEARYSTQDIRTWSSDMTITQMDALVRSRGSTFRCEVPAPSREQGTGNCRPREKATKSWKLGLRFAVGQDMCDCGYRSAPQMSGAISADAEARLKTKASGGNCRHLRTYRSRRAGRAGSVTFCQIPPGCFHRVAANIRWRRNRIL